MAGASINTLLMVKAEAIDLMLFVLPFPQSLM